MMIDMIRWSASYSVLYIVVPWYCKRPKRQASIVTTDEDTTTKSELDIGREDQQIENK